MSALKKIEEVALMISEIKASHPVRVGIDGATASGKTTFSKNLSKCLQKLSKEVIPVSLDNFHNQKIIRYKGGRNSPESYFNNAYNVNGIINNLLRPVSEAPNFYYKSKIHDLVTDEILDRPWEKADKNSILIVEGSFSLRKKLRDFFDFKIFLDVQSEVSEQRASVRDAHLFESKEAACLITRDRYLAAHKIYLKEESPMKGVNIIVRNDNPLNPIILGK